MNTNQNSDLPIVLLFVSIIFFFIGIRTLIKKKILKGRSSSEYIEGKKAEIWGWIYIVLGIGLAFLSIFLIIL
jgi:hypothetical protein